jgi:hypothetical protein
MFLTTQKHCVLCCLCSLLQLDKATADAAEYKAGYDKVSADAAEFKAGYDKVSADAAELKAGFDKAVADTMEHKAQVQLHEIA